VDKADAMLTLTIFASQIAKFHENSNLQQFKVIELGATKNAVALAGHPSFSILTNKAS